MKVRKDRLSTKQSRTKRNYPRKEVATVMTTEEYVEYYKNLNTKPKENINEETN